MTRMNLFKTIAILGVASVGFSAMAEEHNKPLSQDVKEAVQDTKKVAKKAGRKVKDETCEMVNGKMECAAKKVGNKIKNGVDEVKDKSND